MAKKNIAPRQRLIEDEQEQVDEQEKNINGLTVTATATEKAAADKSKPVKTSILLPQDLKKESMRIARLIDQSFTEYFIQALIDRNNAQRELAKKNAAEL